MAEVVQVLDGLQGVVWADRALAVDGEIPGLLDQARLLEDRLGQQVLDAGLVEQRSEALVIRHPQGRIVPVKPVNGGFQSEPGMKAGCPRVAMDVALGLPGRLRDGAELGWEKGEIAHRRRFSVGKSSSFRRWCDLFPFSGRINGRSGRPLSRALAFTGPARMN